MWREAVFTFDQILDAHDPKFAFGAALNVACLMKIRAIEPVVVRLLVLTDWDQETLDSECVVAETRNKRRMEELHAPV